MEIVRALQSLGVDAHASPDEPASELFIDDEPVGVTIVARAVIRPSEVLALGRPLGDGAGLLVADRVSEAARNWLRRQGWGWLDRRGHLRFWWPAGRIMIETGLPDGAALRPARPPTNPFSPSGIAVAVEFLLEPDQPLPVRATAAQLNLSAGHVSLVVAALRELGLVDRARKPLLPNLFWALAQHWHTAGTALLRRPEPSDADHELSIPAWVVSGDVAAAFWGAPVVLSEDYPPDLYVPTLTTLRIATHRFGEAGVPAQRSAIIRVTPTKRVIDTATDRATDWPVAHPVIAALDLTRDPTRGREILDAWTPPDGYRRVW